MDQLPRGSRWVLIALIVLGTKCAVVFFVWLFQSGHMANPVLFGAILVSAAYKTLRAMLDWYHFAQIRLPEDRPAPPGLEVDVFTTACPGEPREMIVELHAALPDEVREQPWIDLQVRASNWIIEHPGS